MEKKYQKMIITLDNVSQAQAIALKKMFEHMEYLGRVGSSRFCSFMADGDGDFRPKVSFEYPEELPEVKEIDGVVKWDEKNKVMNKSISTNEGDFIIDFDSIAWKIYH